MPAGELYIKYNNSWKDAYTEWGVSFDSTALSTLMTPAPLKGMIENSVATEHGVRVVRADRKLDGRTITLGFNMTAQTKAAFMTRYANFCSQILANGKIDLKTAYQNDVVYHLDYLSCQSFGEYQQEMGKFALRVAEPNPGNRTDS